VPLIAHAHDYEDEYADEYEHEDDDPEPRPSTELGTAPSVLSEKFTLFFWGPEFSERLARLYVAPCDGERDGKARSSTGATDADGR
jgi:hypothetical protein